MTPYFLEWVQNIWLNQPQEYWKGIGAFVSEYFSKGF